MKILLHMGQGKTGTTALQQSLHAAADDLRGKGVLYPRFGGGAIAHHLLVALCGNPMNLPSWTLNSLGGPDAAVRKARTAWEATCAEIRANPPEVLILSSELLLGGLDGAGKARLAQTLLNLSEDIQPILYVRHPVEFYRSALQEMLKDASRPFPPVSLNLRGKVLAIEAAFPQPPAFVAYDKGSLFSGDTIPDFALRFLMPLIGAVDLPLRQANPGLSAEALVLLAQKRADADAGGLPAPKAERLKRLCLDFDRNDPPARPLALLPEVAEAALRSATCHRWLDETGRLRIPGLDMGRIDGAAVPDWMMTAAPETLFLHDPARLARLRRLIDERNPTTQTAPGLLDRVLRFLNRKITAVNDRTIALENPEPGSPALGDDDKAP